MFFGSGNLVFPLLLGKDSGPEALEAFAGLFCTGVVMPLIGAFGMILCQGNLGQFFNAVGKKGAFAFSLLALGLLGPFGVIARCFTVTHAALAQVFPFLPLFATSTAIALLIFLAGMKPRKIIPLLGSVLTPFLLFALGLICILGLWQAPSLLATTPREQASFLLGILEGYNTMDLLAAFFFSRFLIEQMRETDNKLDLKSLLFSFSLGGGLLAWVYLVLVQLGARFAPSLSSIPPHEFLGHIAYLTLGEYAAPLVCIAIGLACITTALALSSLFAEFLRKEVCQEKIGRSFSLGLTLTISCLVSTYDFMGIMRFLSPLLQMLYPLLIAYTLFRVARMLFSLSFRENTIEET